MALKLMYTLVLGCVLVLGVWANTEKLVIHSPPTSSEAIVDMQPFLNHYHHLRPTLYWPYDTTEPMQIQTFPLSSNETSALMYISVMGIKSASEIRVNWPATDPTEFELNLVCKTIECKDLLVMIRARYDGISVPHGRYLSTEPQDVHKVRFSAVLERALFGVIPESTKGAIALIVVVVTSVLFVLARLTPLQTLERTINSKLD